MDYLLLRLFGSPSKRRLALQLTLRSPSRESLTRHMKRWQRLTHQVQPYAQIFFQEVDLLATYLFWEKPVRHLTVHALVVILTYAFLGTGSVLYTVIAFICQLVIATLGSAVYFPVAVSSLACSTKLELHRKLSDVPGPVHAPALVLQPQKPLNEKTVTTYSNL
jgi:hypothetical protein